MAVPVVFMALPSLFHDLLGILMFFGTNAYRAGSDTLESNAVLGRSL
jgi:hypothetical protein